MLTDVLCTRCGLCCDGTLFGDVELRGPAEAARVEALGLAVDTDDADTELLALPCVGLRGTRCGVYAYRPHCCRTFECRLLQRAQRGQVTVKGAIVSIDDARAQVARVHALLAALESRQATRLPLAERIANALTADAPHRSARAQTARGQLQAELHAASTALRGTLQSTFLD